MFYLLEIIAIIFGMFELISNSIYLTKKDGILMAYHQHREVPSTVSEKRMRTKVMIMLCVGCIFILGSLLAFILPSYSKLIIRLVFSLYCAYTWVEAISYKNHKLGYALACLITVLAGCAYSL